MKIFGTSEIGRGVLAGGFCGYMLTTLAFGLMTGSNMSGVPGFIIGVPAGMVVGGVVAAVRARRRK